VFISVIFARSEERGTPYGENEKLEPSESAEKTHDPGTSSPFGSKFFYSFILLLHEIFCVKSLIS